MTEKVEPKEDLDGIIKAVSLVISASVVGSVCFDWGFLSSLDVTFREVPSTLADHARSALLWAPTLATAILVSYALQLFGRRVDREAMDPALARRMRFWPGPLRDPGIPIFTIIATVAIAVLAGERAALPAAFAIALIWNSLAIWLLSHPTIRVHFSMSEINAITFGPMLAIVLFGLGWSEGFAMRSAPANASIQTVEQNAQSSVRILRTYERGLLVLNGNRVEFIQWSSIQSTKISDIDPPVQGALCRYFQVTCDE